MENSKIILINKEKGITSFKKIRNIQKELSYNKIGHAGTLDPMAQGLVIAMSNKATKLSDLLMKKNKVYKVEMELGYETDTLDAEGVVVKTAKVENINLDKIIKVCDKFTGKIKQVPPKYSAIKVNGKKLYELARKNIEVDIKERDVEIFSFKDIAYFDNKISFEVFVSSGTYIRSLVRDIALELGTFATMTYLLRSSIDIFKNPVNYEVLDVDKAILLKKIIIDDEMFEKIKNGVKIKSSDYDNGFYHCYLKDKYVGIISIENNILKRTSFFEN